MPSALTWLDDSERDRRRALDVIDLFRETGTLDELGMGAIRDSFSDLLFPGTSTIQTRACYFLLLPWTFLRLERLRVPSAVAAERARSEELKLNQVLCAGADTDGVFGSSSGWALKRLPSAAYWGGLGSWGIRLFPAHLDAYVHSLDDFYRRLGRARQTEVDPEGRRELPANWHPHVPEPPPGFPYEASVALRLEDARNFDRRQLKTAVVIQRELARQLPPLCRDLDSQKISATVRHEYVRAFESNTAQAEPAHGSLDMLFDLRVESSSGPRVGLDLADAPEPDPLRMDLEEVEVGAFCPGLASYGSHLDGVAGKEPCFGRKLHPALQLVDDLQEGSGGEQLGEEALECVDYGGVGEADSPRGLIVAEPSASELLWNRPRAFVGSLGQEASQQPAHGMCLDLAKRLGHGTSKNLKRLRAGVEDDSARKGFGQGFLDIRGELLGEQVESSRGGDAGPGHRYFPSCHRQRFPREARRRPSTTASPTPPTAITRLRHR